MKNKFFKKSKKSYKEKDLEGFGHVSGIVIKMNDKKYQIGKDGEYRKINIKEK